MRNLFTAMLILLCLAACGRSAPDPAMTVLPIYDRYQSDIAELPPLEAAAPWTDELRLDLAQLGDRDAPPGLLFDPFVHAQDWQIESLSVTSHSVLPGESAIVKAAFENFGRRDEVLYDLVWTPAGWRIANIRGANWDFREILADGS